MNAILALIIFSTLVFCVEPTCNYNTPVVGVLAQHSDSKYGTSYIAADYVNFYSSAGAQVVPVFTNQPQSYYEALFDNLNGVVFPGGGVDLGKSSYYDNVAFFMQKSKELWDTKKEVFPIFGTCLGFEAMVYFINSPVNPLSNTNGTSAVNLPVKFTDKVKTSVFFGDAPDDVISQLEKPVCTNNHHFSLLMSTYNSSPKLQQSINVLATSVDADGDEFAAIIESSTGLPWYGTQFHPEKSVFEFKLSYINHDPKTIRAMQYIVDTLVTQSRKSCHKFPSHEELHAQDINNYPLTYISSASEDFQSIYYFNN